MKARHILEAYKIKGGTSAFAIWELPSISAAQKGALGDLTGGMICYVNDTGNLEYYDLVVSGWQIAGTVGGLATHNDPILTPTAHGFTDIGNAVENTDDLSVFTTLTATSADVDDAVTKKHTQNTDTGTTSSTFTVDTGGNALELESYSSDTLRINNASGLANIECNRVIARVFDTISTVYDQSHVSDNELLLNYDLTAGGENGTIAAKRLDSTQVIQYLNVTGLGSACALANHLKIITNAHAADAAEHTTAIDNVNYPILTADASDLASLLTLVGSLLTAYDAHDADAALPVGWAFHDAQETGDHSLVSAVAPINLSEAIALLNELKSVFNAHDADVTPHTTGSLHQEDEENADTAAHRCYLLAGHGVTALDYIQIVGATDPLNDGYYLVTAANTRALVLDENFRALTTDQPTLGIGTAAKDISALLYWNETDDLWYIGVRGGTPERVTTKIVSYTADVTSWDGVIPNLSKTITHGLGTYNVFVSARNYATPPGVIELLTVDIDDTNNITVYTDVDEDYVISVIGILA